MTDQRKSRFSKGKEKKNEKRNDRERDVITRDGEGET